VKLNGSNKDPQDAANEDAAPARVLPPAALRALAEAEARREQDARPPLPPEINGRDGPEPVRYGDWEKKGIAIDF
jgi:hypothetical protein